MAVAQNQRRCVAAKLTFIRSFAQIAELREETPHRHDNVMGGEPVACAGDPRRKRVLFGVDN